VELGEAIQALCFGMAAYVSRDPPFVFTRNSYKAFDRLTAFHSQDHRQHRSDPKSRFLKDCFNIGKGMGVTGSGIKVPFPNLFLCFLSREGQDNVWIQGSG